MADNAMNVMHEKDMQKVSSKQKIVKIAVQVMLYTFLGFMALIVLFPFYFMLISSVKTMKEYELSTPTFWPRVIVWGNYSQAFKAGNLGRLFSIPFMLVLFPQSCPLSLRYYLHSPLHVLNSKVKMHSSRSFWQR